MTDRFHQPKGFMPHVALQAMACTMGEYDYSTLRAIYEKYNKRVTPIENDVKLWIKQGLLTGARVHRYSRYDCVRINPERWAEVASTISPESITSLLACPVRRGSEPGANVVHFLRAFCLFCHQQDFASELQLVLWPMVLGRDSFVLSVIRGMFSHPEYAPFLIHINQHVLRTLFDEEFLSSWMMLEAERYPDVLQTVFLQNELIDQTFRNYFYDSYLYYREFLVTGQLQQVLSRMSPTGFYHHLLRALQLLHEGDAAGACAIYLELLKDDTTKIFQDALTNFCYGLALGQAGSPQARKVAEKLMKNKKVVESSMAYAMLLVLHHHLLGDAAEFYQKRPLTQCGDLMGWRLAVLFLKHYLILERDLPAMADMEEWVATAGLNYLRLLYADDFARLKPLAAKLRADTGIQRPLLPPVRRKERWEQVIDQLEKLNTMSTNPKAKTTATGDLERVAYIVNLHNYNVQPKLQKSKDGGITWSKGRNIAMKTFGSGNESYLTPQDRRVATMVETYTYGWYGQVTYQLAGARVIAALAGCPSVYSEATEQRIDIVEDPLQLLVQTTAKGFAVSTNVDLSDLNNGYCITRQGDKQVSVTPVSATQQKTLELLAEVGTFPKDSKSQLTKLLQTLSGQFTVMSPLLKNADSMKHVEANALMAVQIAPAPDQQFSVQLAVKPFGTHPPYQRPGKGMEVVSTTIDGERVQTERNLKLELHHLEQLRTMMAPFDDALTDTDCWLLDTAQCLQLLELLRTAGDVAYAEWPQGVKMRVVRPVITPDKLSLKISSAGQWFEVEGTVTIGDKEKIKIHELMERLHEATGNFIRLSDDEYIALSEQLRRQLQTIENMMVGRGKSVRLAPMNGLQLQALEEQGARVKADEPFRQLIQRIGEADHLVAELPANIHAELRSYQLEGYRWMSRLAHWGAGACLADDMGLGKTLQSITLMQSRAAQGPQLVVVPTSVLMGWQQELNRFAPALSVKVLNTQGADRQKLVSEAAAGDVVLATYGLLVTEGELLKEPTWTTIVLDEAHTIKNRDTQTSKAAMQLQAHFRLMLTGTPLQNHLSEIWNLFQFANPGLLGSFQQFTDRFILPIERDHNQERQRMLRRLLAPFMLRRTKDDVLSELPEKTEITLSVELSPDELALYDNLRQQAIVHLEEGTKSPLQTLAEITRLRQAACHPRLINDKLPLESSKTKAFLQLVEELRQSGHRALVFSQFTSHLALIREALDKQRTTYLYLDGSTSSAERDRLVRQFQTGDAPLFLISLKAGGLGLNLTAADYVVHLDPWWNPAIEDQASDRAHRIGQERPVTVYRLIAAGTIEEKMIRLHQNKRSLADALLQDADMFATISADEVIRLLRESAESIR